MKNQLVKLLVKIGVCEIWDGGNIVTLGIKGTNQYLMILEEK